MGHADRNRVGHGELSDGGQLVAELEAAGLDVIAEGRGDDLVVPRDG